MKSSYVATPKLNILRAEGYTHVDKTKQIHEFIKGGQNYCLITRPPGFGKKLMVSTMKEIFEGNQELFKGLWIYDKISWNPRPVIHFDFTWKVRFTEKEFAREIEMMVCQNADYLNIKLEETGFENKIQELIGKAGENDKIVVLVDDYDFPIIYNLHNKTLANETVGVMKSFFEALEGVKDNVGYMLVTGAYKFSLGSFFTDSERGPDINQGENAADLLGFTWEEIDIYYKDVLNRCKPKTDVKNWYKEIENWFGGYSRDGKTFVYNPLSLLSFFKKRKFENYHFGYKPIKFIIDSLKSTNFDVSTLDGMQTYGGFFNFVDINCMHPVDLLFHAGYLSIKNVEADVTNGEKDRYTLGFTNNEALYSYYDHIYRKI